MINSIGLRKYCHPTLDTYFLLTCSACAYAAAFFKPVWYAELVFIAFSPIFFLALATNCSFWHGFYWGMLFNGLYFHGIGIFVWHYCSGSIIKVCITIFFLLYAATLAGLWFSIAVLLKKTSNFFMYSQPWIPWILATLVYFEYIHHFFFIIFGVCLGNKLHQPLLPLIVRPAWLSLLCLSRIGLTIVILIINSALANICRSRYFLLLLVLCMLPFLYGWIYKSHECQLPWAKSLVCCYPKEISTSLWQQACNFCNSLREVMADIEQPIIISPESSFAIPLNEYQELLRDWSKQATIFIGAQRYENHCYFNTLYHIQQGRIIDHYDKRQLLFLAEYLPSFTKYIPILKYLLIGKTTFSPGREKKLFVLANNLVIEPLICAEIFFDAFGQYNIQVPILVVVNDTWFVEYIKDLLLLYARWTALYHTRIVIYSSYSYGCVITSTGSIFWLPHFSY